MDTLLMYRLKWKIEGLEKRNSLIKINQEKLSEYNKLQRDLEGYQMLLFYYEEKKEIVHHKMMKLSKDILQEAGVDL
jgi:hypothetical protein